MLPHITAKHPWRRRTILAAETPFWASRPNLISAGDLRYFMESRNPIEIGYLINKNYQIELIIV
jgi:hypothetical protein